MDAVIHNAGVMRGPVMAVNVVAPYLLTALMPRPGRLVYLTSGLESAGRVDFDDLQYLHRPWDGMQAYSDSKLYDVVLAFAVARLWPGTPSNAVDPGWIRTKLGGPNATDGIAEGASTQVWLVDSDEPAAVATGRYLKRGEVLQANPAASDLDVQERLLAELAALTGVKLG
jgi:NAD(P)-dependent dehydrogenase (short-subunit alcohol dehydrogenase family)